MLLTQPSAQLLILFCGGIESTSHAGYSYSGRAAAYAFGNIDPTNM